MRSLRNLAATPRLSLAALACAVIGVASALVVSAISYAVLVRQPELPQSGRLARIWLRGEHANTQGDVSFREYEELRALGAFDALEGAARTRVAVGVDAEGSERIRCEAVSTGYFALVGVRAARGRLLESADFAAGAAPVALIGHELWQRRFGGRGDALGSTLRLRGSMEADERAYTVVGVLPRGFTGTVDSDVSEIWLPLPQTPHPEMLADREARNLWLLARLRPGSTLARAQDEAGALLARWRTAFPAVYAGDALHVEPFGESWRRPLRRGLVALAIAGVALLLIACGNVAHLLAARVARRERELAMRRVLGEPAARIVAVLALESLLLAGAGGAAGVALAAWAAPRFAASAAIRLPSYVPVRLDATAVAIAVATTLLAGVLSGTIPALLALRVDGSRALRGGSGRSTIDARQRRYGRVLVVAQVAITAMLAIAGTLLVRSYRGLEGSDLGFRTDAVLRLAITLDARRYGHAADVLAFADEARATLRAQPGVAAVSLMSEVLPPWYDDRVGIVAPGAATATLEVPRHAVDADFLRVLAVPLVAGRGFDERDRAEGAPVAIVSRTLARRLAGGDGRGAIGLPLRTVSDGSTGAPSPPREIVGVAADVAYNGPAIETDHLDLYLPFAQEPHRTVSFVVLAHGDPGALAVPLQRALARIAPSSPVHWVSTMGDELRLQLASPALYARTSSLFAAAALGLAFFGIYGLFAHALARRTPELAIRSAVGARPAQLAWLLLAEGSRVALAGLAIGLAGGAALAGALGSLLHGVRPLDAAAFAGVALLLFLVTLLAGWLPATRALRVNGRGLRAP